MEQRGMCVSVAALKSLEEKYAERIATLTGEIYDLAGEHFNIASTKQLGEILFEKLMLPHGKRQRRDIPSAKTCSAIFRAHIR